ncbi:hypothetical protein OH76DRAFT_1018959 [Lentinus brumalis]|uniref:C2H2-type domain-containing protein n=1 Tax=Lentinus brumalis TaxID=2498619 RepID=A0A371CY63_9APHY|nr:hypothetical protein OH76DRAFT_1018959 [Polyporus brumalis]
MKARRWNLMKMSAEGAFTEQRLALPATRDAAGCMRPVTRSQTKSRSSLKRKGPSQDTAKTGRPAKLARTASTSSGASAKRKPREPAMGVPTDVPRSMLMSFRVDASPFQLYDGERNMTVDAVSQSCSPPRFPATASQPMFDHSWQVADADPSHTADDEQSLEVQVPICAPPQLASYPTAVPFHLRPMLIPHPPSAPSPRDVGPMLPHIRLNREHGDENRSPAGMTTPEEAVSPLKAASLSIDRPIAPLCSSTVSSPNRPARAVSDEISPSWRQQSPAYVHPVPLAVMSTPSPMSSIAALSTPHSATSSPSITRDNQSEVPIVEPVPPCYLPGQTSYATHHILPLHPGYMLFGGPSPVYPSLMPPLSHLPPNGSHPTDGSLSTPNHAYQPYLPIHPGVHPGAFVPAHTFDSHTPSPHLQGIPLSVSGHDGMHGQPAFMPQFAPQGTTTPWCAMFDSLKGGSKRLGGPSKQKKRTADLPPTSDASYPSAASPSASAEPTATEDRIAGVHACPLCPRTFSLPNSLAIHLKWHWGASSLDWKRGINMQGKGLQRAFRDAEKRRDDVDKLQFELEQAFAGEPDPATAGGETGEGAVHSSEPEFSFDPMYAFDMPVIAQSSLSSIFDFAFSAVNASVSDDNSENQASAGSSQMPHASSSSSPTLLSSSAAASFSDSSAYGSVPLTPELVSADSGSSNAASVAYGSPTWSYALFGGELDHMGANADVRIDGEFGVDMDDLFGGFDIGDISGGTDGLNIGDGLGIGEAFNIGERLDVGHGLSTGGDSAAYSSDTHLEAEGLNSC